MNIKIKAYQLKESGLSYGQVAKQLEIGRTTAYDYIKEIRMSQEGNQRSIEIPNSLEPTVEKRFKLKFSSRNSEEITSIEFQTEKKKVKEFTGDELIEKKFDSLEFEGKFLELIGKPSKLFSAIIWGLPKGGKSNFSIRFADYLQEYFGDVVYIAAEEGESVTLQEKIKSIGGSKVTFAENKDRQSIWEYLQSKSCEFVFIDSINNAGIDNEFLELIKQENPSKSFISIVQATKGGNFKGDQALTHNCDFIIKVIAGVAYHSGRFNTTTEISIFDQPLYEKNPVNRKEKLTENSIQTEDLKNEQEIQVDDAVFSSNERENQTVCEVEPESLNTLSSEFAAEKLKEINNKPENVSLPKLNFKKSVHVSSAPIKPMSSKTLFWILGIAGAASLLDSLMKGSQKQKTGNTTDKK
ncbi:MAG TPA: hypothetical protein VGF79_15240 [Bacteroidia bacterium]